VRACRRDRRWFSPWWPAGFILAGFHFLLRLHSGAYDPTHNWTGALAPQARLGNRPACALMRGIWRVRFSDLGPSRAMRLSALRRLEMRDRDYGWTAEMQIAAARRGLRALEVPVRYRRRTGRSRISGTVRGTLAAGRKILWKVLLAGAASRLDARVKPRRRLILFTRYPQPGRTKTRLIPALGAEGAAALQREMTEHALEQARDCCRRSDARLEVRYAGGTRAEMRAWLGEGARFLRRGGGDLGARMRRAFDDAFETDCPSCVLIGADRPGLSSDLLAEAFGRLAERDIVLGPAADGGYYLIGLRDSAAARAWRHVFGDMR